MMIELISNQSPAEITRKAGLKKNLFEDIWGNTKTDSTGEAKKRRERKYMEGTSIFVAVFFSPFKAFAYS